MRLRRAPHQAAGLGDRPRHVHTPAQHVEVLDSQRGHLAPPQAGVGQEPDHLRLVGPRLAPARPPVRGSDSRGRRAYAWAASRPSHGLRGGVVLHRRAEHLAQQPECVLDRRSADPVGDHLGHPRPDRRGLHIDDRHVTPLGFDPATQALLRVVVRYGRPDGSGVPDCCLSELHPGGQAEFGVDVGEVGFHGPA